MSLGKTMLRLLPRKKIQIGRPGNELDGISSEYFQGKEGVRELRTHTEDCEHPVLFREIFPTQISCPVCRKTTLAGLSHCDKCGAILMKTNK